jgi:isocitrate dehydrogenase
MGKWNSDSKTHVAHMNEGDFYGNEKSVVTETAIDFKIELAGKDGKTVALADGMKSVAGEILDGTFMSKKALRAFYKKEIADAKAKGVLFSLHLK